MYARCQTYLRAAGTRWIVVASEDVQLEFGSLGPEHFVWLTRTIFTSSMGSRDASLGIKAIASHPSCGLLTPSLPPATWILGRPEEKLSRSCFPGMCSRLFAVICGSLYRAICLVFLVLSLSFQGRYFPATNGMNFHPGCSSNLCSWNPTALPWYSGNRMLSLNNQSLQYFVHMLVIWLLMSELAESPNRD